MLSPDTSYTFGQFFSAMASYAVLSDFDFVIVLFLQVWFLFLSHNRLYKYSDI